MINIANGIDPTPREQREERRAGANLVDSDIEQCSNSNKAGADAAADDQWFQEEPSPADNQLVEGDGEEQKAYEMADMTKVAAADAVESGEYDDAQGRGGIIYDDGKNESNDGNSQVNKAGDNSAITLVKDQ